MHANRFFRLVVRLGLAACALFFGTVTVASATPSEWTDVVVINEYIGSGASTTYYHNLNDDGFDPGIDLIEDFNLNITLYDDFTGTREDIIADLFIPEIAFVDLPGTTGDRYFFASLEDANIGVSIEALITLNILGFMKIDIVSAYGDFFVGTSTLVATGTENGGPQGAIPEPTAALVFALGMVMVGSRARRLV